jgi:hypothetical protein
MPQAAKSKEPQKDPLAFSCAPPTKFDDCFSRQSFDAMALFFGSCLTTARTF